ncbi:MAG: hypothetical protein ACR2PI_00800 [Hyphomicrobiaceae bacterium]
MSAMKAHLKPLARVALSLAMLLPTSFAHADLPSCRAVFEACQRWCRDNRGGPERFVCKGNCQTEFNASLNSGIFHREDGHSVRCSAIPHVVWRERPSWSTLTRWY